MLRSALALLLAPIVACATSAGVETITPMDAGADGETLDDAADTLGDDTHGEDASDDVAETDTESDDARDDTTTDEDTLDDDTDVIETDTDEDVAPDVTLPEFQVCVDGRRPTGLDTEDWEHTVSSVTTIGDPWHSADGVIAVTGQPAHIHGKFTYGALSKDLEGEFIEVWMDDCSGTYTPLGRARTDSDGRIDLVIPANELPPVGHYALYLRVVGDGSWTHAFMDVVPPETQYLVMDIDGTLTTDDLELFSDIGAELFEALGADYVPEARDQAIEMTHLRYNQGYQILYVTGRPYWLTGITREWLEMMEAAPGVLRLASSNAEVVPNNTGVGDYKLRYLEELIGRGVVFSGAYGNSSTDIYAFQGAGIPNDVIWVTGPNGGDEGTIDLGDDYVDHVNAIFDEDPIAQPFVR